MKTYRLTAKGRKIAQIPSAVRDEVLDYLFEHKEATRDELEGVFGREKVHEDIRDRIKRGLVEEKDGYI